MLNLVVPKTGNNKDLVCLQVRRGFGNFVVLVTPNGDEFRARPYQLRQPTEAEKATALTVDEFKARHGKRDQQIAKTLKGAI